MEEQEERMERQKVPEGESWSFWGRGEEELVQEGAWRWVGSSHAGMEQRQGSLSWSRMPPLGWVWDTPRRENEVPGEVPGGRLDGLWHASGLQQQLSKLLQRWGLGAAPGPPTGHRRQDLTPKELSMYLPSTQPPGRVSAWAVGGWPRPSSHQVTCVFEFEQIAMVWGSESFNARSLPHHMGGGFLTRGSFGDDGHWWSPLMFLHHWHSSKTWTPSPELRGPWVTLPLEAWDRAPGYLRQCCPWSHQHLVLEVLAMQAAASRAQRTRLPAVLRDATLLLMNCFPT